MELFHATEEPISPFWLLSRKRRMGEALIFEGPADTSAFEIYIANRLTTCFTYTVSIDCDKIIAQVTKTE